MKRFGAMGRKPQNQQHDAVFQDGERTARRKPENRSVPARPQQDETGLLETYEQPPRRQVDDGDQILTRGGDGASNR